MTVEAAQLPLFSEWRLPLDSNAAFYAYPTTAGCYAIQADSDNFTEVIIFAASLPRLNWRQRLDES